MLHEEGDLVGDDLLDERRGSAAGLVACAVRKS
jgi:hypothetical protein